MTREKHHVDLVVIGGGPAGCAAAIAGRRAGLQVIVIEGRPAPMKSPSSPPGKPEDVRSVTACSGWVSPAAAKMLEQCGVALTAVGAAFAGLRLRPWDLSRCVAVDDAELCGWTIDPTATAWALLGAVRTAGVEVLQPATAVDLALGETAVTVRLDDGRHLAGRVAVIADGAGSRMAQVARFPTPVAEGVSAALAVLTVRECNAGLDVILGAGGALRVATVAQGGGQARVSLVTHDQTTPVTQQLETFLAAARDAGLVPREGHGRVEPAPALAGAALDYDAHVGKRCLLVGEAGGFVSAFSNEGLYPALRSGWLAAEVAAAALRAPVLQDELAGFGSVWRADLAEYLRMPNTDLGLLLPMVFTNAQMSRRIARAFFLGQAF